MSVYILGISAYYHDSAAAIIRDGEIIAAAQEERFTRKKHDSNFPLNAVKYVINAAGIDATDLSCVVFYDKPLIKFERLLETYHAFVPEGIKSFLTAIPIWLKEKLFMKKMLYDNFRKLDIPKNIILLFPEHHLSHAASAFYPSPFNEAAILTIDGVGEWATTTIGYGQNNDIKIIKELDFPHSLGLLYSSFTYYCGFRVNSGEYKLMGLAPYGKNGSERVKQYYDIIINQLIDIRPDGSFLLNMEYFNYATGLTMVKNKKWEKLFGIPCRKPDDELSQPYMDLALAIQKVTDEIVVRLASTAKELTNSKNLVLAGGVALNCVSNSKILENNIFENVWIQPAAGDAGGSIGAALAAWHIFYEKPRKTILPDLMKGSYLGPSYAEKEVYKLINRYKLSHTYYNDFSELSKDIAIKISEGNIIGWFQGNMEFGPRALGNRSILGDPRNPEMQKKMNLKIKYRESFRPFAPAILEEDIAEYVENPVSSPYMLLVLPIKKERRNEIPTNLINSDDLYERLYYSRSDIPAVTHIDYSARIQTVSKDTNPRFWTLINDFKKITGYSILINTSFNIRGEPIVCSPFDALRCFANTEIDYLVIGNFLFDKKNLPSDIKEKLGNYNFIPD